VVRASSAPAVVIVRVRKILEAGILLTPSAHTRKTGGFSLEQWEPFQPGLRELTG